MILRKPRSLITPQEMKWSMLWDFRSQHVAPVFLAVSTNQNWKRVCIFLRNESVVKGNSRSRSFSLSSVSHNSIRCCPPTLRPSTPAAHQLLQSACQESSCAYFSRLVRIIGIRSCSLNFRFQGFFIFIVRHFDSLTWRFSWFKVIT